MNEMNESELSEDDQNDKESDVIQDTDSQDTNNEMNLTEADKMELHEHLKKKTTSSTTYNHTNGRTEFSYSL